MSISTTDATAAPGSEAPRRSLALGQLSRLGLLVGGLIVLLSFVRVVSGVDDLTSSGTTAAALRLAVPIGLAALGGLWAERAGVVNIGLEGMLILGTWFGGWAGWQFGPWWGVVAGILGGALGGLLHALATVSFGVDHIISGVAINILGAGVTQFLSVLAFTTKESLAAGGGETQSPKVTDIGTITFPGLSDGLRSVEKEGVFLVSDLSGMARGLVTDLSYLTIVAALLVPLTYFVLWRTAFGLRLRSCGENPTAAESLGVNVYKMKYAAVVVSGGLAGFGGAFLTIVAAGIYREGQTGGRGFIGLAAMIFGNWMPGGMSAGAGLFGFVDALQLRGGGESVHALLLLLAILLAGLAVWQLTRRRTVQAVVSAVAGGIAFLVYVTTDTIPSQFVFFAPHLTTLLVLSLAAQRLRMPAADGQPYRRGQAK